MPDPVIDLLSILDLEQIEQNIFRGRSPQIGWQRVFGGLVISQALVAASRTVEGRSPHSLHCYFLLPGDPSVPIVYEVERVRDGRSFTTRRCVAVQHGRTIFVLSASFQIEEDGLEHSLAMPEVPPPDSLPGVEELKRALGAQIPDGVRRYLDRERPIEFRPVDASRYSPNAARAARRPSQQIWMRASGRLPDDPAIHRAVLAYLSDMTLLDTALVSHGKSVFDGTMQVASLDHAIWFHRSFRADEWMLYDQESPNANGARGLTRGSLFSHEGHLIASVMQEGLMRPRAPRS
ncbi:MAG: acyl-CoA thioesterase II [Beijerinckiaceae bacterium]|nr:acyl-CoA thioesterase II [Beijerinckiaceae bacterium]